MTADKCQTYEKIILPKLFKFKINKSKCFNVILI